MINILDNNGGKGVKNESRSYWQYNKYNASISGKAGFKK
jgi:hypothetical protein